MLCSRYPLERGIIASVITLSNTIRRQLDKLPFKIIELSHETPVPITNLYKTPQTLGMDRLAAVVAATWLKPNNDVLVIDAGTCVTIPRWQYISRNAHALQSTQYIYGQAA